MSDWRIDDDECLAAPGATLLVFHGIYLEGKQGGIELFQHGERVATNGDLRFEAVPGQWARKSELISREADRAAGTVTARLRYPEDGFGYSIRVASEGEALRVTVDLDAPLPAALAGTASFILELYPPAYYGASFRLGRSCGVFPRQAGGAVRIEGGVRVPEPLARGRALSAAAEDPTRALRIERLDEGELELIDGRAAEANGWFVVRSPIAAGSAAGAVELLVRPNRIAGWRREPALLHSQLGYHPDQAKICVIELDPADEGRGLARLTRIEPDGGRREVMAAAAKPWGSFLRYRYSTFDFSSAREEGIYLLEYEGLSSGPFRIGRDVYSGEAWRPTLETYFPVQMCHMEVRDGSRVWHGACHLDDALQAPLNREHFDGYRQGPEPRTAYEPGEHIPGLDRGGWHDAGDYDLAAGGQAGTTHTLALIREEFGVDTDQTTVDREARLVLIRRPDGLPDIVQQVAHGAENLLSGYRAADHSFCGIIESEIGQYVHLGDAATMTDNLVYDPALGPRERNAERSGKKDDRWAFTDRDSSLEYAAAVALAAASRVLRGYYDGLAEECLAVAVRVWDYEGSHERTEWKAAYVPGNPDAQEVLAAVELLIATGDDRYRSRIVERLPVVVKEAWWIGWSVSRIVDRLSDVAFSRAFEEALDGLSLYVERENERSPFGLPFPWHIWGVGWQLERYAVWMYHLAKAYPSKFDRELVLRVVNYVLGCHPGSSLSLVSGVGSRSLTVAYGINRADESYIPGGTVSGPNLCRPGYVELKEDFPYLWQQSEYVMTGAADWIFCALAADRLLNPEQP